MKKLFITFFICFLTVTVTKGQISPPPPSMPTVDNTELINQIISLTHHEEYFFNYCQKKVRATAEKESWNSEKLESTLGSIKFKYYNDTIYNSYAFYTTEQLQSIIKLAKELNKDKKNNIFILTNEMMQNNLDLFISSVIQGKYIMKSNK